MISGDIKLDTQKDERSVLYSLQGPIYQIDINGDGNDDYLQVINEDGCQVLLIRNHHQIELKKFKLWAPGANSVLYKIKIVDVNADHRILVLYLDEGRTESTKFESTARLHFVSIDKKDFSTMTLQPGPRYWHEREAQRDQYWRRSSVVEIIDLDHDGTKEIFVKYRSIQWVYHYLGAGQWNIY